MYYERYLDYISDQLAAEVQNTAHHSRNLINKQQELLSIFDTEYVDDNDFLLKIPHNSSLFSRKDFCEFILSVAK